MVVKSIEMICNRPIKNVHCQGNIAAVDYNGRVARGLPYTPDVAFRSDIRYSALAVKRIYKSRRISSLAAVANFRDQCLRRVIQYSLKRALRFSLEVR